MAKDTLARLYLDAVGSAFRRQKSLGEGAMRQLEDDELHAVPAAGMNSVAVIVRHMAGNMRSRWTDFLTTDGEKPWRDRDDEFVDDAESREALLARWEGGWAVVFGTLRDLDADDLLRTVRIRGKPLTALEAILRHCGHASYHVGQMVSLARQLAGERWESLSIPRGESDRYNESMGYRADADDEEG